MFDRLVESNSADADFKPRRKFFLASSVVMGMLFATTVVASIYTADFDLGTDNFDIAELLTPIAETEPVKEPEQPRQQTRSDQQNTSDSISRQTNMARLDEVQSVPTEISTTRNQYLSRPASDFEINLNRPEGNGPPPDPGTPNGTIGTSSVPPRSESGEEDEIDRKAPPAPPTKPKTIISDGVINGKATHLPKPAYSAAAIAMGAKGTVNVQVTIDESGKVISARAISGNPILRVEAQKAAWNARFSPTYLSKVPVKVTGVIVYNFVR
ncbi:MAG TPA: energy transducer TonB [Pyrinomonadaceae bacterium]|nr:energy transducer TonB [Pyrinomonadaceae bacterium]